MPFTPSHVAAAIPLLRTPLLPAALVVGTTAPDIPYYVPLFVPRALSHSLLGLVSVDLVLGVIGALLWWFLLREPIIDLLPRSIGRRIPFQQRTAWRPPGWGWPLTVAVLLLSVLVGAATHLIWDSFTHPGWLVDHVNVLRVRVGPLPVAKWLQHVSSVGGLGVVGVWAIVMLRRASPDPARPTRLRSAVRVLAQSAVVVAGLAAGLVTWVHGIMGGDAPFDPNLVFLVARLTIGVAGAAVGVLVLFWFSARARGLTAGTGLGQGKRTAERPTLRA